MMLRRDSYQRSPPPAARADLIMQVLTQRPPQADGSFNVVLIDNGGTFQIAASQSNCQCRAPRTFSSQA